MTSSHHTLAASRWRIAIVLTVLVVCIYFGFIALIAYQKGLDGLADRSRAGASGFSSARS